MADNPTFTNQAQTFSTNANPDIPVRGDADVNGKIRQVVRLDVATGTSESLISAANPLPITGAITGPLTPAPSSTGNHMAVSGPVGAMYYTSLTIAASPASTDQILQFSSVTTTGAGGTYRGDLIGIMASGAGSQYSSVAIVGEVESVTSTTVTLKNPLPYTPTSSFKVYFFRRGYLPLIASSTNIGVPLVPVDISNNMVTDGQDPSGVNVAGKGLPIEGWDLSAGGVNRQLRMRNAAPASNDVGVVVRDPESPAQTASLSVLDDWDETDRAKVNLIAGQVGVQGGSGVVTANTQRVVLATDVALPAGNNNIGDVDVVTLPGVAGTVAHDGADSGNPVKVGYRARTTNITAVATDDRVDAISDPLGRGLVQSSLSGARFRGRNASLITNTTSTSLIAAAGAGISYVITSITVTNTHATQGTEVSILGGSTVVWSGPAASDYGGYSITFDDGLVCTANTAINAQCGTSGASVRACVAGHTII